MAEPLWQYVLEPGWQCGAAQYVDGLLVLDDAATLGPARHDSPLYDALAAVNEPADAIAFIRRHGMLHSAKPAAGGAIEEPWDDWNDEAALLRDIGEARHALQLHGAGDSRRLLGRVCAPIYQLSFPGRTTFPGEGMYEELERDEDDDSRLLRWMAARDAEKVGGPPAYLPREDLTADQRAIVVEDWIAHHLRKRLSDLGVTIGSHGGTGIALRLRLPDVLSLAYLHLLMDVHAAVSVDRCQHCGRVYPKTDARQRYCTPRCRNRAGVQRHWRRSRDERAAATE